MVEREITYHGRLFVYPADSLIGPFLEAGKGWDSVLAPVLETLVPKDGPTIVEVGSNIGASLAQMLATKPKCRVFAFEPSARFRPYLERNVALMGASERVEIRGVMLGERPGLKKLHNNATTASAVSRDYDGHEPKGSQWTRVTTLDRAIRGPVDFLKVDVDGLEFEVLRGARKTLMRHSPALHFELAPYLIEEPEAGLRWLQDFGYRRFVGLSPEGAYVGTTEDPREALRWTEELGYCDFVSAREGLEALAARLT